MILTIDFSAEMVKKKEWKIILKVLKENNCQLRILFFKKFTSFKFEGKIRIHMQLKYM